MARMASAFITNGKPPQPGPLRGFTLVELMLASVISAIVFAAIFSAYIFMARNLARMANFQQQQVQNRQTFYYVGKDVSDAVQLTGASSSSLVLTLSSGAIITYTCVPAIPSPTTPGTLSRMVDGAVPAPTLLSNLTTFSFGYYDKSGAPTSVHTNIKQVELRYTSAVGDKANGTQSSDIVVSARMVLRGVPSFGG